MALLGLVIAALVQVPGLARASGGYTVRLTSYGSKKINVVKAVKSITGFGLVQAKALVENVPSNIKSGLSQQRARIYKRQLQRAGGSAEIR